MSLLSIALDEELMHRAMALGSKPWNRSKVMFVGEGRVGKTALCNSMLGKPFVETESTVGLTQLTCDVQCASSRINGRWTEHKKPNREYEAGIAQLVRNLESSTNQTGTESVDHRASNNVIPTESNSMLTNIESKEEDPVGRLNSNTLTREELLQSIPSGIHEVTPRIEPDTDLVVRYLADVKVADSGLIFSLFDFGGQSVFNIIHHLFLTSYGVYVVVFRMMDLLDDNKKEQSLAELSFWINSIVIHTFNANTRRMAPVFLVGTHKDVVSDPRDHKKISNIIEERFRYNIGWPSIIEYHNLCFYPVNNRIRQTTNYMTRWLLQSFINMNQEDQVIADLMTKIENVLKEVDYVNAPRPLTWLKALDELLGTKKNFLPLQEASSIAIANGVERGAIPLFLSFLNEMGVVLWLDEAGLRDVVILDIIKFFVEPATLIICNHISKPSDSTIHHEEAQKACKKFYPKQWDQMISRGVVGEPLMYYLLGHRMSANYIPVIINLMLKYGLVVKLEQSQESIQGAGEKYLVPALLPSTAMHPRDFQDESWSKNVQHFNSCYFIFIAKSDVNCLKSFPSSQLRDECFLPKGLMERLIGKAVRWSQLTSIENNLDIPQLYKNYAVLPYGRQLFRLVCIPEINCIRLDVEGEHPLPVYNRICEQMDKCVKECLGSLSFITALRLNESLEPEDGLVLINLEAVTDVHRNRTSLAIRNYPKIDREYVINNYISWLVNTDLLEHYDVFISHRWHNGDDFVIDQLYDAFLGCTVGSEKRAVQVFLDKVRLKEAQQFQRAFGKALIKSSILLPILCPGALKKMLDHDPTKEDNVLIEWMLALECVQDSTNSKLRGIYPLMFGERGADRSIGNLFSEGIIDLLPITEPTASIKVVKTMLEENNVNISSSLANRTVRSVVKEIGQYLGFQGWDACPNGLSSTVCDNILRQLDDLAPSDDVEFVNGKKRKIKSESKGRKVCKCR